MREFTTLNITCNVVPVVVSIRNCLAVSVQVKLVYEFLVSRTSIKRSIKSDKMIEEIKRVLKILCEGYSNER